MLSLVPKDCLIRAQDDLDAMTGHSSSRLSFAQVAGRLLRLLHFAQDQHGPGTAALALARPGVDLNHDVSCRVQQHVDCALDSQLLA